MSAARSYVCNDCGLQLRSVKEAQDHGEVSGHSNFAESEEAVLTLVCEECGKPCRSATERDLHTTRTGHDKFVDKTAEQASVNTEQQFAAIKEELNEDLEPKPMDTEEEAEMVPAEVDAGLLSELTAMGFNANRATRALHTTGTSSMEQAINWIMEHENDADIDTPLLVPKGAPPKVKLSPRSAKAAAAELVRKAKAKKEKEEREMEKLREQERIRSGKELQEAKRKEADQERKRLIEWRKREKAELAAAKAKAMEKVEEDRRARRIAAGLPPDLTPEELEAKRAKEQAKADEQKAKAAKVDRPVVRPVTLQSELRELLVKLKRAHPGEDERVTLAFNTLLTYLGNIVRSPSEEKFRSINLGNAAFQRRLGSLTGGLELLQRCGFVHDTEKNTLYMPQEAVDMAKLHAAGEEINTALTNPFFGVL